jgi:Ulp1 family protease
LLNSRLENSNETWTLREEVFVPQQLNTIDCGVCALLNGLYTVLGRTPDYQSTHLSFFRRRMVAEILQNSLTAFDEPLRLASLGLFYLKKRIALLFFFSSN